MLSNSESSAEQVVDGGQAFVPQWRKSSHSQGQNQCVEVAAGAPGGQTWLRDSKDPDGPVLRFTSAEWTAFVAGTRDGEFGE